MRSAGTCLQRLSRTSQPRSQSASTRRARRKMCCGPPRTRRSWFERLLEIGFVGVFKS